MQETESIDEYILQHIDAESDIPLHASQYLLLSVSPK